MRCFRRSSFQILLLGICLNSVIKSGAAPTKKKACIIGAGMSGLAIASRFKQYPEEFDIVVFDRNTDIAGLWQFTNSTTVDENNLPVHSSMYGHLRTNIPKQIMAFPFYRDFLGENRSCVRHETVVEYLRNLTDHFNLRPHIKLNHLVEKVTPIVRNDDWRSTKWIMRVRRIRQNDLIQVVCDAVVVANGRFSTPNIPVISGIETFPGRVLHSHTYRWPEEFKDKTVVVLGASISGQDIGIEISEHAKTVYLSHNKDRITSELPSNIIQVSGVLSANGTTFTLRDGTSIDDADALVLCTGYLLSYPFLDESSGIKVERTYVSPLYKHMINIEHPSMAFIGVPTSVDYPALFSMQTQYFVSLMRGIVELPCKEDMLKSAELNGKPKKIAHMLGDQQWAYDDELAREGEFEPLPEYFHKGYDLWTQHRLSDLAHFKDSDMLISDDGGIEIRHHED